MTLTQSLYFASLGLFGFVIFAARRIPDGTFILASIMPVFLSAIVGVIMWVYAWSEYGATISVSALVVAWLTVCVLRRLASTRTLFVMIYVALSSGLVCARLAMQAASFG